MIEEELTEIFNRSCSLAQATDREKLLVTLISGQRQDLLSNLIQNEIVWIMAKGETDYLCLLKPELLVKFAQTARQMLNKLPSATVFKSRPVTAHLQLMIDELHEAKCAVFRASCEDLRNKSGFHPLMILRNMAKGITTFEQFCTFVREVLNHASEINSNIPTQLLQYLGSFDPQHIGHRIVIKTALERSGLDNPYVCVNAMHNNPLKPSLAENYFERKLDLQIKLLKSSLLETNRIFCPNIPSGIGLSMSTLFHARLLAAAHGDNQIRCVIGSDKFLHDLQRANEQELQGRSLTKYSCASIHFYVAVRQEDEEEKIGNLVAQAMNRFPARFTLLPPIPYDGGPASSTKVKELLRSAQPSERLAGIRMERGDII